MLWHIQSDLSPFNESSPFQTTRTFCLGDEYGYCLVEGDPSATEFVTLHSDGMCLFPLLWGEIWPHHVSNQSMNNYPQPTYNPKR